MKKRILCAIMLTATLGLSQGCFLTENTSGVNNGTPTVKWYNFGPTVREMDLVLQDASKYTMEKIGARLECINMTSADFSQKMSLILASNEVFDMCFTASYQNFLANATKNSFLPLNDLIETHGKDMLDMLPEGYLKSATINGTLYAVPALKDNAYEYVIGYNKKLVEEIGFDVTTVKDIYDIEPCLAAFKEKYPNNYPLEYIAGATFYPTLGYIDVGGAIGAVDIYDTSGKVFNPYETEKSKEYFKIMHEWYKKGYMRPDVATAKDRNGVGFGIMEHTQKLPYQRENENKMLPEDKQYGDIRVREPWVTGSAGSMVAISRTSKHPEKTMEFINLLNTDAYLRNLMAYGIEGKHYIAVGDNHYRYPDGVETRDDNSYFSYPFTQGNMFITRTLEGTPDDIWDKYREFDARAIKAPTYGFSFDGSSLKAEMSALNNVKEEFVNSLTTGAVDPDIYLPRALEKMKEAGVDKVIAEMQRQLDEWRMQN